MLDIPERRLWAAVLADQIVLALREHDHLRTGANPELSQRWIGSADFVAVCALAGVDHVWVEKQARRQLAMPRSARLAERLKVGSVSSRADMRRLLIRKEAHHA